MLQQLNSSLLEIEAADYFKLDSTEVLLFTRPSLRHDRQDQFRCKQDIKMARQPNQSKKFKRNSRPNLAASRSMERQRAADAIKSSRGEIPSNSHYSAKSQNNTISKFRPTDSPTISSNSLPSISSSPSLSPSLVCPHLSLDDILSLRNDSRSANTVGLCARCRLDPPPNVQSPLSPAFKPSAIVRTSSLSDICDNQTVYKPPKVGQSQIKRGYSDHQARNSQPIKARTYENRDDSLDFYLDSKELQRLQMSPTLRNSVKFIRKNQTEAGRVIIVYKNGQPFDKPLRICVMRGEFATLNHLLDFINSRQLIPSGARYLFHIDGQLVYSVNELKHGSTYIVSGTRTFNLRASNLIKEQQRQSAVLEHRIHSRNGSQSQLSRVAKLNIPEFNQIDTSKSKSNSTQSQYASFKNSSESVEAERSNLDSMDSLMRSTESIKTSKHHRDKSTMKLDNLKQRKINAQLRADRSNFDAKDEEIPAEIMSKSSENLSSGLHEKTTPISMIRAKSELSGEPKKRKKNVTFLDTGRGSSPVKPELEGNSSETEKLVEKFPSEFTESQPEITDRNTNEIGIQVSDSIEGFLIDLPLPLPAKVDETRRQLKGRNGLRRAQIGSSSNNAVRKPRRQVVTITERQLSVDEMDKFRDLDHGDHHKEARKIDNLTIKLDSAEADAAAESELMNAPADRVKDVQLDQPNKIEISKELDLIEAIQSAESRISANDDKWQYPGGRAGSITPTERPVSQSDANETVRATVITPTPSLSTAGDNNSLSMSYDNSMGSSQSIVEVKLRAPAKIAPRQRPPVLGRLCAGIDPPKGNFQLEWVSGFTINDQFLENGTSQLVTDQAENNAKISTRGEKLLSPANIQRNSAIEFRPKSRFHNWLCHSRKYDELIYPAGCLVVLWCRWNNEQRYYSQHSSSVSAIALASLDADLAVSAQIALPAENIRATVHLWSLKTLETLQVVDNDQFREQKIYSLNVRNRLSEGCELSVVSQDDKRLWLFIFALNLSQPSNEDGKKPKSANTDQLSRQQIVIKTNKVLQPNQVPLLVEQLSNTYNEQELSNKSSRGDFLLSFGRRHFQVWLADRKRQKLCQIQAAKKSAEFAETISRANCIMRMSPGEYLIGDAEGRVSLIAFSLPKTSQKQDKLFSIGEQKYNIEMMSLFHLKSTSITSLSRISGSLFVSGDSTCTLRFWRLERPKSDSARGKIEPSFACRQLTCISLPRDLGFICSIVSTNYNRKQSLVELYIVSTSNAILFGSVQVQMKPDAADDEQILANSSVSVVYEGHETSVMNLVADREQRESKKPANQNSTPNSAYFTCSLDCKICKWSGKGLVWKSMLPSSCTSLAVHPIGFVLAVGSADGTVYILDKISGLLISYFPLTPVCINCLAYSRDGSLLAAGCANGSIFILPVHERGLKYKKVSIFQSPYPVVSLQFSVDDQYILTSVSHGQYQELILWDLPNFRYMRDNVKMAADQIKWFDSICSGSEDVRAIWENANIMNGAEESLAPKSRLIGKRLSTASTNSFTDSTMNVINLSCHRLIRSQSEEPATDNLAIASDTRGFLRLFRYPCYDIDQAFLEVRISSGAVNCCRFLSITRDRVESKPQFVSTSLDGTICLWKVH